VAEIGASWSWTIAPFLDDPGKVVPGCADCKPEMPPAGIGLADKRALRWLVHAWYADVRYPVSTGLSLPSARMSGYGQEEAFRPNF
jgi:hypothetical protein